MLLLNLQIDMDLQLIGDSQLVLIKTIQENKWQAKNNMFTVCSDNTCVSLMSISVFLAWPIFFMSISPAVAPPGVFKPGVRGP
mgnify:FL=1